MKWVDLVLYEFQRRANQKQEESFFKKIKSAEPGNPTLLQEKQKPQENYITPQGVV